MLSYCGFFLDGYKRFNKSYRTLFGQADIEEQGDDEARDTKSIQSFEERWGWFHQAELLRDYEGIPLSGVWDLPIIQALNGLSYLKDKNKNEKDQIEKIKKKNGNGI